LFRRLFFILYYQQFTFNLATAEKLLISQLVLTRVVLECLILLVHICRVPMETIKRNFSMCYICVMSKFSRFKKMNLMTC